MVSKEVKIVNPSGLNLRPAGVFCAEAAKYSSLVTLTAKDYTANAKSVLSVLAACAKPGDIVEIVCSGEDEQAALEALCKAVEDGLGEAVPSRADTSAKEENALDLPGADYDA